MTIYTVHVPHDASDHVQQADRTTFVREGFSIWGLVFGWVFLLWHRLWAALAVWIVLAAVLVTLASFKILPWEAAALFWGLMHLFVGVEGNDLRRWSLDRRRFSLADIVSGPGRVDAEYAYFVRQPEEVRSVASLPSRVVARDASPAVIGMFPDGTGA
jgi:hypothetical protein